MNTVDIGLVTTDRLETALVDLEAQIAARRHLQMRLLDEVDLRQVASMDGARNLTEWVAARMDVSPETAQKLTQTGGRLQDQPTLAEQLAEGAVSFDRVVEESRLVAVGADPDLVARSRGWDLAGLRRMSARHQRLTRPSEQQTFAQRSIMMQPSLDETFYKIWTWRDQGRSQEAN